MTANRHGPIIADSIPTVRLVLRGLAIFRRTRVCRIPLGVQKVLGDYGIIVQDDRVGASAIYDCGGGLVSRLTECFHRSPGIRSLLTESGQTQTDGLHFERNPRGGLGTFPA